MPEVRESGPARVMVLISGSGSNMEAVIAGSLTEGSPYRVEKVIADRSCPGLVRASHKGIPAVALDRKQADFGERLLEETKGAEFIILAGFLSILEPRFIRAFAGRIINIHPSLLPAYGGMGMHGRKVHEAVLRAGDSESGCSCHLVTEEVDAGPVLVQRNVPVYPADTADDLQQRVLKEEHACIVEGLLKLIDMKKGR